MCSFGQRHYCFLATVALVCVSAHAQANGNGNGNNNNGGFCESTSFTEDFSDGIEQRWEQLAGAEHDGSLINENGGLELVLREAGNTVTQIRSRALFTTAEIEFTFQTNSRSGVMYNFVAWPAANERALGEIDLEMLGGGDDTILRVPIWAPGHGDQEYIGLSNAPGSWNGDADGPRADWGAAQPHQSANCLNLAGFDQTQANRFHLSIQEDRISWSVNEQSFATYTRGEDASEWPLGDPMMMSISLWTDPGEASWMGEYNYNAQDPPRLVISDVSFEGCVTNSSEDGNNDNNDGDGESNDGQGHGGGHENDEDGNEVPDGSGGGGHEGEEEEEEEEEGADEGHHEEGGEKEENDPPIESGSDDNPFGAGGEEEEEEGSLDSMSGSEDFGAETSVEDEYTTVWESSGDEGEDLEGLEGDEEDGGDGLVTENGSGDPDETEQVGNDDSSARAASFASSALMLAAAAIYQTLRS